MPRKSATRKPRLIFVSSPYRGDVSRNLAVARAAAKQVFDAGHVPVVPHLYIPLVLDDDIPEERDQGIAAALKLLSACDEMWLFGEPTQGMAMELEEARRLDLPVHEKAPPTGSGPCWRCGGGGVVRVEGDLASYVVCPECSRPAAAGRRARS